MTQARPKTAVRGQATTDLPTDLETAQAKLCYLALAQTDRASLDELQADLDLGKLTLLEVLGTLTERGHVAREQGQYWTC